MTICGIADNVAFTPALARVNFTRAGPRRKQSREAAGENYRISFSGGGEGQLIVARNYEVCAFRAKSGRCPCLI